MKSFLVKSAALLGRALSLLIASLPRNVRGWLGDLVGLLWFDVLRIRRKVAIDNVKLAYPELTHSNQVKMARDSLRHLGRNLIEFSLFPFYRKEDFSKHFRIIGQENLDAALEKGRGVLILAAHLGNGDFGVAALSRRGVPISLISKKIKTKWLNDLWFGMREKHGTRFISAEKSSFQILRALKSKRVVFFVLDQYMGSPVGAATKFFGVETGTAMGLAIMADRSGSPVISAYTYREESGRHVIVLENEILWQDASTENIAGMTQIYTDRIEQMVRKHPEQWMWIHRRWKKFR